MSIESVVVAALMDTPKPGGRPRDAASVHLDRVKVVDDHHIVAFHYEDRSGIARRGMIGLRESSGWMKPGGSFVNPVRPTGPADEVWASWGGWSTEGSIDGVVGGWVSDPATTVVRLVDPQDRTIEGDVENGVAILTWTGPFDLRHATPEVVRPV